MSQDLMKDILFSDANIGNNDTQDVMRTDDYMAFSCMEDSQSQASEIDFRTTNLSGLNKVDKLEMIKEEDAYLTTKQSGFMQNTNLAFVNNNRRTVQEKFIKLSQEIEEIIEESQRIDSAQKNDLTNNGYMNNTNDYRDERGSEITKKGIALNKQLNASNNNQNHNINISNPFLQKQNNNFGMNNQHPKNPTSYPQALQYQNQHLGNANVNMKQINNFNNNNPQPKTKNKVNISYAPNDNVSMTNSSGGYNNNGIAISNSIKNCPNGNHDLVTEYKSKTEQLIVNMINVVDGLKINYCEFLDNFKTKFVEDAEFMKNVLIAETIQTLDDEDRNKIIDNRMEGLFREMMGILSEYHKN